MRMRAAFALAGLLAGCTDDVYVRVCNRSGFAVAIDEASEFTDQNLGIERAVLLAALLGRCVVED